MLDFSLPVSAQVIEAEAVLRQVGDFEQPGLEERPLSGIGFHLENGVLHPLSHVFAGLGHLPQPFGAVGRRGRNVIRDEHIHGLFPKKRRVDVHVATEMPGEQAGLQKRKNADGHLLLHDGVINLFGFALLPGS